MLSAFQIHSSNPHTDTSYPGFTRDETEAHRGYVIAQQGQDLKLGLSDVVSTSGLQLFYFATNFFWRRQKRGLKTRLPLSVRGEVSCVSFTLKLSNVMI